MHLNFHRAASIDAANPLTYPNNAAYCHLFRSEIIIFAPIYAVMLTKRMAKQLVKNKTEL